MEKIKSLDVLAEDHASFDILRLVECYGNQREYKELYDFVQREYVPLFKARALEKPFSPKSLVSEYVLRVLEKKYEVFGVEKV